MVAGETAGAPPAGAAGASQSPASCPRIRVGRVEGREEGGTVKRRESPAFRWWRAGEGGAEREKKTG